MISPETPVSREIMRASALSAEFNSASNKTIPTILRRTKRDLTRSSNSSVPLRTYTDESKRETDWKIFPETSVLREMMRASALSVEFNSSHVYRDGP